MGKMIVIGLCGPAGCGKSTAAAYLAEHYGFKRLRFADPLKAMLRAYYATLGLDAAAIEERIEGFRKETIDPFIGMRTPRYAMQSLGTEWGRNMMNDALWTEAWLTRVYQAQREDVPGVVVEDVRFPNEVEVLRYVSGKLLRIVRPSLSGAVLADREAKHSSEGQPLEALCEVPNDGTAATLGPRLLGVLSDKLCIALSKGQRP